MSLRLVHRSKPQLLPSSLSSPSSLKSLFTKPFTNQIHLPKIMSWACTRCTFLNPPSQKSTCQMCLSPPPPPLPSSSSSLSSQLPPSSSSSSSSHSPPKWSCKACTFLNPYSKSNCEICDTRATFSSLSTINDLISTDPDDDNDLGSSVGSVFYPLRRCANKIPDPSDTVEERGEESGSKREAQALVSEKKDSDWGGFRGAKSQKKVVISENAEEDNSLTKIMGTAEEDKGLRTIKILTYNVWFREDLELHMRMQAIGDLIQHHSPDVICFQEVTPNIYAIFQRSSWWKKYCCSVSDVMTCMADYFCVQLAKLPVKSFTQNPFSNSIMGRELCIAEMQIEPDKSLVVATSHLESPCPAPPTWNQMFSKERVEQAREAIKLLGRYPNVIFCGDMNWDDKLDGQFPFPEGWVDAWKKLRPAEVGWTYDTKSNKMISGNRSLQKRLDRFICNLPDFEITEIQMIGKEAIPGLSYCKEKKVKYSVQKLVLPVLPSDHYGLLLSITCH